MCETHEPFSNDATKMPQVQSLMKDHVSDYKCGERLQGAILPARIRDATAAVFDKGR